jgi:N-acyl-D-aspartate/D-glutamate deacylase
MGEESFERQATEDEIVTMRRLLREAMEAGAFGFPPLRLARMSATADGH